MGDGPKDTLSWQTVRFGAKVAIMNSWRETHLGTITKCCKSGRKSFQVKFADGSYATYRHPERFLVCDSHLI